MYFTELVVVLILIPPLVWFLLVAMGDNRPDPEDDPHNFYDHY